MGFRIHQSTVLNRIQLHNGVFASLKLYTSVLIKTHGDIFATCQKKTLKAKMMNRNWPNCMLTDHAHCLVKLDVLENEGP